MAHKSGVERRGIQRVIIEVGEHVNFLGTQTPVFISSSCTFSILSFWLVWTTVVDYAQGK